MPTPDGRSLYVTTTRDSGYGAEDNYITTRDIDGMWGPLVNLGTPINGPGDDRCLTWTPDGKILLFDSLRAGGFGGQGYLVDLRQGCSARTSNLLIL